VSTRTSFCALAVAYATFALATPLWGSLLEPAADGAEASEGSPREEASSDEEALAPRPLSDFSSTDDTDSDYATPLLDETPEGTPEGTPSLLLSSRTPSGAPPRRLPPSALPFRAQLLTPHFAWLAVWSLCATSRVLYLLGTVQAQAKHAGGERSDARAARLVETFNSILPLVAFATPAFGALLDAHGAGAGLALVNVLGVACYVLVQLPGASAPVLAYACFGCFRVWNFACTSSYTQGVFGNESFGRVYGLGANFFNLIAAAAQYPLIAFGARAPDRGYALVDAALVALAVPMFAFPAWVRARVEGKRGIDFLFSSRRREDGKAEDEDDERRLLGEEDDGGGG
jgi:hypothetical protein